MAGGEGSRLRPLTSNQPKPMMPLVNLPMMEHIIGLLKRHGFDDIVVTLAFMPNAIRTYFGDGSEWGVRIVYATEEQPLGTAGSVRNAMDELRRAVPRDLRRRAHRHRPVQDRVVPRVPPGARDHRPRRGRQPARVRHRDHARRRLDRALPREAHLGAGVQRHHQHRDLRARARDLRLHPGRRGRSTSRARSSRSCSPTTCRCSARSPRATGRTSARSRPTCGCTRTSSTARSTIDIPGFRLEHGVWLGEGAEIHPEAVVDGPAVIGENCRVEANARIGEYTVLGGNVRIREGADLERVVIHDNAYLGPNVRLRGTVVGRACDLRSGVRCEEGVVLGDECFVGDNAVLGSGVKVYPFKTVETAAVVNSSIVWESRGARSLFGRDGVSGLANVDITPELATRLAMAHGSSLKKETTVITSRDSSRSARMLKRAMMAGLNAAGVNVLDLEVASVPVTRFVTRQPELGGRAQHPARRRPTRSPSWSGSSTTTGLDLSEDGQRKIERLFNREDFRRVLPAEIGDIGFPPAGPRAVLRRPRVDRRRGPDPVQQAEGRGRLRVRVDVVRDAERAGQARCRRARGQPVRVDQRRPSLRPGQPRRQRRRARPGIGRPPRRGDRPRRRAPHADRRRGPRAVAHRSGARAARPRVRPPAR